MVLGAVALARQKIGDNPFDKKDLVAPPGEEVKIDGPAVCYEGKKFKRDFYITVNGKAKAQKPPLSLTEDAQIKIVQDDLFKACMGGPETLFIGTGNTDGAQLSPEAEVYLAKRKITAKISSTPKAVKAYNKFAGRKAILLRVETQPPD